MEVYRSEPANREKGKWRKAFLIKLKIILFEEKLEIILFCYSHVSV